MKDWRLKGFRVSPNVNKMYYALLENKWDGKLKRVHFGHDKMQNFRDITQVGAYPHLIHGDVKRRKAYRARAKNQLKPGYFSSGYFSYFFLW